MKPRLFRCGCGNNYYYDGEHRIDCAECNTAVKTEDNGVHVIHRNARGQIVNRTRSKQAGTQNAAPQFTTNGLDHGADLAFGDFAFIGGNTRRKR